MTKKVITLPINDKRKVLLLIVFAIAVNSEFFSQAATLKELYQVARHTRIQDGHAAAQPLYAEILERKPSDLTTSTRLAASTGTALQLLQTACSCADPKKLSQLRQWFITSDFTSAAVGQALNVPSRFQARAPIYITPAAAGTINHFPFTSSLLTPCQCLAALFLLGLTVPLAAARQCCSEQHIQLLKDVGLTCQCEHDDSFIFAVVSIMPINLMETTRSSPTADIAHNTLYVVTDWHPRVLNTVQIFDQESSTSLFEEAVMYIGPDSLALVEHWILHPDLRAVDTLLDVCTGSGVQALSCLMASKCQTAVCVDINQRALRFTAFSAALNGLSDAITLVQGDLLQGTGCLFTDTTGGQLKAGTPTDMQLVDLLHDLRRKSSTSSKYGMLTANPPFLPVPESAFITGPQENVSKSAIANRVAARHGLFSAGGSSGEAVLAAILELSNTLLVDGAIAAVVSEFFFRNNNDEGSTPSDALLRRLHAYWTDTKSHGQSNLTQCEDATSSKGTLLTNEFPISVSLYAERRADSAQEADIWKSHLDRENIATCSPGLLYVQKTRATVSTKWDCPWKHVTVPKSELGSIWTPSNFFGVQFTQAITSREYLTMNAIRNDH